jgi:hypothetical protein
VAAGISDDRVARYLEQRLESWAQIEDVPVEGEYNG